MPDLEDQRWSNAVVDGLLKNKYHDIMLILFVILAFFLLILVSASST
jgi:hypothetical protein